MRRDTILRRPIIPRQLSTEVLSRDNQTCQMCGLTTKDEDPFDGKPARIEVGLLVPEHKGGDYRTDNLRAICSSCAEGLERVPYLERPSLSFLLGELERAEEIDLRDLADTLSARFPGINQRRLLGIATDFRLGS